MKNRRIKILVIIFFCLLGMIIPGAFFDFKSSMEFSNYSVIAGLVISLLCWPLTKEIVSVRSEGSVVRYLFNSLLFYFGMAILITLANMSTVGLVVNRIIGDVHVSIETIKRKGCDGRRCRCHTQVHLTTSAIMANGSFCIEKELWLEVKVGQEIRLTGVASSLGFDVYEFEAVH